MELRIEKAFGMILAAVLAPAVWGQSFEFQAMHKHWRKGCAGTLRIDASGVTYQGAGKHSWNWAWQDVQRFDLSPSRVSVLTYKDSGWKLGADREYVFSIAPGQDVTAAYAFLKGRLDQRFVARLADEDVSPLWEMPNVLLSPHVAGSSLQYDELAIDCFAENMKRYLSDQPLLNLFKTERGY